MSIFLQAADYICTTDMINWPRLKMLGIVTVTVLIGVMLGLLRAKRD